MSKLVWDIDEERFWETGVSQVALYPWDKATKKYGIGVPWNGVTAVTESPSGAEPNPIFANNIKYLNLISAEEFGATLEAYTYPDEFAACDGSLQIMPGIYAGQQSRNKFCLAYLTNVGNDTEGHDLGKKLHIIYNAMASPSEKAYATINDSPEAISFSWELTTTPVEFATADNAIKHTASLTIDQLKVGAAVWDKLLVAFYGSSEEAKNAEVLMPDEIMELVAPTPEG